MRFKPGWIVVIALLVTACGTVGTMSDSDRATLAAPPQRIVDDVTALLPGAIVFIDDAEREILRRGRPLTDDEARLAQLVGVAHPEQVRVLVHDDFIEPRDRAWVALAQRLGVDYDGEFAGRTSGHGIELAPRRRSRSLMAHELTHVAQYERLGTPALLRQYFTELLVVGYERSPIEAEARGNERIDTEQP
jgi:hypothetical protein